MVMPFRLGLLDIGRVFPEQKAADVLWNSVQLAPRLEAMGYSRYWLSEHHTDDVAHSSPELMVPVIAGLTDRMRVGTAGVLLRFYHPLKVAKSFRLLHALFPGRIDLGLARGSAPPAVQRLLGVTAPGPASYADTTDYEARVDELLSHLRGTSGVTVNPAGVAPPEVWMLGSQQSSARLAAARGTALSLALFLRRPDDPLDIGDVIAGYRKEFQPSRELTQPNCSIAVAGVCCETEAEARETGGRYGPNVYPSFLGTPAQCADYFAELRERHGVSEFVFLDLSRTNDAKLRSCQLVAEALGVSASQDSVGALP